MMHRQSEQFDTEQRYAPHRKHPELFGDKFREEWLHPDVVQILKTLHTAATTTTCTPTRTNTNTNTNTGTSPSDMDMEGLAPMLHKEAPEIYSFHCLSSKFLQLLNEELAHFYHTCETHKIPFHRPNSSKDQNTIMTIQSSKRQERRFGFFCRCYSVIECFFFFLLLVSQYYANQCV